MADLLTLSAPDLAALLCSRVCHDVIGPAGALQNGLEVLDEGSNEDMKTFAMDLIRKSAQTTAAKLKFCRIAFGAAGSAGAHIDSGDAETVVRDYLAGEKPELTWDGPRALVPKDRLKLLLNLVIIGISAIPRGGDMAVRLESPDGDDARFSVACTGKNARVPEIFLDMLNGTYEGDITAHEIQPYYTMLLARESGLNITATTDGETVTLSASA